LQIGVAGKDDTSNNPELAFAVNSNHPIPFLLFRATSLLRKTKVLKAVRRSVQRDNIRFRIETLDTSE